MTDFESQLAAQWQALPPYLVGHIQLTLTSLALGIAISLPLGIVATRNRRIERVALGVASVLQTIPGLALLALMVPLLGVLGGFSESLGGPSLPSIGFLPGVLALSLYSILPMLRNTVTGISGVDASMVEAARGVGMNPREVLLQVELPLALPTIVAGIRTATVWVVGMATLATPVGGTSLGNPIFAGLQTRNLSAVLVGSLAAAGLALCLDGWVRLVEVGVERRSRVHGTAAIGLLVACSILLAVASGASRTGSVDASEIEITIGSKAFTEQYILAEILAQLLVQEKLPGDPSSQEAVRYRVSRVPSLGSTVAFDALVSGDLDLYVDYSGTLWATILKEQVLGSDRESVYREVERRVREEFGVVVISRLGFENTYALATREEDAEARSWRRISDLASSAPDLEVLGDFEFFERPEWVALRERYALRFGRERAMDSSLMYEALRSGEGDVISAYSTDGRIEAYGLRVLEDDRGVIPPYDAVVLASEVFVRRAGDAVARIEGLSGKLSGAQMRRLNGAVDLQGQTPLEVGQAWLAECFEEARGARDQTESSLCVP